MITDVRNIEAAEIVTNPEFRFQATRTYKASDSDIAFVNRVFVRLKAIIPAWRQALQDEGIERASKAEWFKAFSDAGVSEMRQIDHGFYRLRQQTTPWWPPVAQFIQWCQEVDLHGIPSAHDAYREFCSKCHDMAGATFSHPIVCLAGKDAGVFEMRSLPESKSFPIYQRSFEVLRRRAAAGEELGIEIPKALPAETQPPVTREENQRRMSALISSL